METQFVMYHYVRDIKKSKFSNIKALDIKNFKNQLRFLKSKYNILSIDDFFNGITTKNNKKNCVLTFDDGYSDHYDYVFEILLKNDIKAAFYPPVDVVLNGKILDVNKIHLILASTNENKILSRLKYYFDKEKKDSKNINFYIEKIKYFDRYDSKKTNIIKQLLQTVLDYEIRTKICDHLLKDFVDISFKDLNKSMYLNTDQIIEMKNEGMHFGSHGKSHFWFDSLSYEKQEYEIKESVKFLDQIYQRKDYLLSICYPYGNYNNDTIKLAKKYNFKLGLTTFPEVFSLKKNDLLKIPRFDTNDFKS